MKDPDLFPWALGWVGGIALTQGPVPALVSLVVTIVVMFVRQHRRLRAQRISAAAMAAPTMPPTRAAPATNRRTSWS